jgi:phytoene dehydrogenase-like protein
MSKKINIIGAGIAGLSAGCYLQMKGFETEIFELHSLPGGLCTSWKKGDYTFDGCLHWLVGSSPNDPFYKLWNELIDMQGIRFHDHEEYFRVQDKTGREIIVYTDIRKLHEELLAKAPEDKKLINEFVKAVVKISRLDMPVEKAQELYTFMDNLRMFWKFLPYLGILNKYGKMLTGEFAARTKNPLLQKMFEFSFLPEMPFLFILMTFSWFTKKSAGYPVGGSLAFSRLVEKKYLELGGKINYHSKVKKILTENNMNSSKFKGQSSKFSELSSKFKVKRAKGIELENGEIHLADITVSCADGHATIFDMLGGEFLNEKIKHYYTDFAVFPSYLQVSLGINRSFEGEPSSVAFPLAEPFRIDPEESADYLSYRILNFDPTLAPDGKTTVIAMMHTYNYQYWKDLRDNDREKYKAEKERVAQFIIDQLDQKIGGIKDHLELVDIASPATVIRYTNNWKGSFEGFLMTRDTGFVSLQKTLPGLDDFFMAGQWVEPGGGVPAALLSGRNLAQVIARRYR